MAPADQTEKKRGPPPGSPGRRHITHKEYRMTDVNIPLLRKAVEWAEEQEQIEVTRREWYQPGIVTEAAAIGRDWGTCYCVGGYIAMIATGDSHPVDPLSTAWGALGIQPGAECGLFHLDNSATDVRRIAEDLAGERL